MEKIEIADYEIYRSIYEFINSNMYVIKIHDCVVVIDPHVSDQFCTYLSKNKVKEVLVLLTHEHPDHISGLQFLKENYNTRIICQSYCAEAISNIKLARPVLIRFILEERDTIYGTTLLEKYNEHYKPFSCLADEHFENEFSYFFAGYSFVFSRIEGHSKGSCCIIINNTMLFTGDSLLKDYSVITRFPGGNKKLYIEKTIPFFETLNKNLYAFPGHGNVFKLSEMFHGERLNVQIR